MLVGWENWSLPRVLSLLLGVANIMIWLQVTIWHARGKFHKWQMWIPVIALPILGLFSILLAILPYRWIGWSVTTLSLIGLLSGLYGGSLHITAIRGRTGGWKMENLMSGPPFILPFMIAATSFIQLLVIWYQ
ncbi:hypothetical protein ACFSCX_20960 [Bacillus salitolerans]|uniref:Uncharacterized protein n=1 Tax=Bacillus salitolerans TaxID=1437434 RepID=A0ABW4LX36_9BACI